jgi:phosphoribosyl 1,2-cyclic phosphodiesterase
MLLLDVGVSAANVVRRMHDVGADPGDVRAVLLTHEHSDHVQGAPVLARRLRVPIYASQGTLAGTRRIWRGDEEVHPVGPGTFEVASIGITPIPVLHDAREPMGFRFDASGRSVAVVTDLGEADGPVEDALLETDALIVESNHDRDRLLSGPYPEYLKRRILSGQGHLSNDQCADLIRRVASQQLQRVVLAHLSQENNRPVLAWEAAASALGERGVSDHVVSVASRVRPLDWMHLE